MINFIAKYWIEVVFGAILAGFGAHGHCGGPAAIRPDWIAAVGLFPPGLVFLVIVDTGDPAAGKDGEAILLEEFGNSRVLKRRLVNCGRRGDLGLLRQKHGPGRQVFSHGPRHSCRGEIPAPVKEPGIRLFSDGQRRVHNGLNHGIGDLMEQGGREIRAKGQFCAGNAYESKAQGQSDRLPASP